MKLIELNTCKSSENSGKYFAQVDDEDFEYLNQFKWFTLKRKNTSIVYARRKIKAREEKKSALMHRQIMNELNPKIFIDHKDRNGLNCQKVNLRVSTSSENGANRKSRENCTSKYLGVHFSETKNGWIALIRKDTKQHYLGRFKTETEAAKAYDEGAKKYHGKFANLNFK